MIPTHLLTYSLTHVRPASILKPDCAPKGGPMSTPNQTPHDRNLRKTADHWHPGRRPRGGRRRVGGFGTRPRTARPNSGDRRPRADSRCAARRRLTCRDDANRRRPRCSRSSRRRTHVAPSTSRTRTGSTHLRNALLEDRSFDWPTAGPPTPIGPARWCWTLRFSDPSRRRRVDLFSPTICNWVCMTPRPTANAHRVVSCEPIAAGLREMFRRIRGRTLPPESR